MGAAKFLRGLLRVVEPSAVTVIVNVGDDERFFGLAVSPDLDTITYTLAGAANRRTGWGLADDSFHCLAALRRYYRDSGWFHLGDRDLATHLYRTDCLARGMPLSAVSAAIGRRFGVRAAVLPASNDRVRTVLETTAGRLPLQRYLVARRARPSVRAIRYLGARRARPAPGVLRAIRSASAVVIAPSNPFLSIGPILAIPGIRRALERRGRVAAISPIIGGRAVTGPLARLLRRVGLPISPAGVAACYRPFVDTMVVDRRDAGACQALAALGCRTVVSDTVFVTPARAARTARRLLAALGTAP